ncbi:hypothetical protein QQ045_033096 [Rhodiola kirilowii]
MERSTELSEGTLFLPQMQSEGANDAEASSSKLPTNDAKDASEKLVTAKGLYDSSTDETKKHVEICQAVVGIQSKLSQFMKFA